MWLRSSCTCGRARRSPLAQAFGFTETARFTSSDGRLSHGEMSIGDGLVMLASPSPDYEGPKRHRDNCEIAASWSALPWIIDGVLVYVEDVDEHYARAKAAGAVILSEPEDGPQLDDTELQIWKDIDGCSWYETRPHPISPSSGPCAKRHDIEPAT